MDLALMGQVSCGSPTCAARLPCPSIYTALLEGCRWRLVTDSDGKRRWWCPRCMETL